MKFGHEANYVILTIGFNKIECNGKITLLYQIVYDFEPNYDYQTFQGVK